MANPLEKSKYMHNARPQIPLRITNEMIKAAIYRIEEVDSHLGYQAQHKYLAAKRWCQALDRDEYAWLSVSGAATPVGFGGLFADLIERGLVDVMVTTGANAYHDLHFACGLPVRHGSHHVNDDDLRRDETTRIYNRFIHTKYTLKGQDMINQEFGRKVLSRLESPFSTASLLYELGMEMLYDESGIVIDKAGSFVIQAAKHAVPVFLDSGSNHSLAMDLLLLVFEGLYPDTSPSQDLMEAAALSLYTQPQLNVFLGEGGPRNFTQTTGPTAAEIFYIPFEGSAGCIRFTAADERTGGLSGSGESEAVTWGKYEDANPEREVVVWGEYTTTAPDVMAYAAGHGTRVPRRLMDHRGEILKGFKEKIKEKAETRKLAQAQLWSELHVVIANEKAARKREGYNF